MSDWKIVNIGDYVSFQNGYSFNSKTFSSNGKYLVVRIKEIKNGFIKFFPDSAKVDVENEFAFNKYKVEEGDILFALTGDPVSRNNHLSWVGRIAIYNHKKTALLNQRVCKVIFGEDIYPLFFYYYFRLEENLFDLARRATGSANQANISTNTISKMQINLPPLDTQKKIAAVLSALDDKIELNNAINKNLEEQAQAIYKNMFVDNLNPAWKKGTLSDIAEITMGQSPSGKSYNDTGKGMIFFQGRTDFGFRFPTIRMFTTEPKRIAKKGDILLSVRAPVGDYNVATDNCCIGRGLASIYSKQNNSSFLLYTILHLKGAFDVFNGQGTVFGAINQRELKNIEVVVPEQSLINEFEKIVAPMDSIILNNCFETRGCW